MVLLLNTYIKDWISPGAVVKMDNKYLDTRGASTAYLFTMDPKEEYVITQVDYQFETLSGQTFRVVCQAFPRSITTGIQSRSI